MSKEMTGSLLASSIITTTANELLQSMEVKHMPVILSKHKETDWIKSSRHHSEVLRMLNPFDPENIMLTLFLIRWILLGLMRLLWL